MGQTKDTVKSGELTGGRELLEDSGARSAKVSSGQPKLVPSSPFGRNCSSFQGTDEP